MKKLIIICVIGLSVVISGCSSNNNVSSNIDNDKKVESKNTANEGNVETQDTINDDYVAVQRSFLDISKDYNNYDTLILDSDLIVKGEVIEVNSYATTTGEIISNLKVKVEEELKDNSDSNSTIEVVSSGGEVNYSEYIKSVDKEIIKKRGLENKKYDSKKIKDEVNGVDQYKVGDNVLVFLYKIKDEDRYGIRGSYNGKFYVGGDGESIYRYKACNSEENYEKFKAQTLKTELDSSLSELKNKIKK